MKRIRHALFFLCLLAAVPFAALARWMRSIKGVEMNELKPCPFCNSENVALRGEAGWSTVMCAACGGEGPEHNSERAASDAWNRRPITQPAHESHNGCG
jgi:Lar family restriction alleviation protein